MKYRLLFAGEIYTIDGEGVRRLTHNELAAMKGLTGYDFNQCKNKSSMCKRELQELLMYICNRSS